MGFLKERRLSHDPSIWSICRRSRVRVLGVDLGGCILYLGPALLWGGEGTPSWTPPRGYRENTPGLRGPLGFARPLGSTNSPHHIDTKVR